MGTYIAVISALGLVAAGLLATGESDTVEPSPPKHLDRHGALDHQSLLMHVETVRLLKKTAACETRGYDAGPVARDCRPAQP